MKIKSEKSEMAETYRIRFAHRARFADLTSDFLPCVRDERE